MNLLQAFKMAFKSIAMKKTRSFLTMLGIIIRSEERRVGKEC